MLPTTALARLAHYAGLVTGLKADYPAPATVAAPALVLFWDETQISEMSEQVWLMQAKGQLMVAQKGNTSGEIARADRFIAPLVDAFSPNAADKGAFWLRTDDGDRVDFCQVARVVPSLEIGYAGHSYYGAELYWSIKLRRYQGSS